MKRPMVISDSLDGVQSMVSGERFDSKSQMRKHYRVNGVTEVGNEIGATMKLAAQKPARPAVTKAEVRKAVEQVKQGYRPDLN